MAKKKRATADEIDITVKRRCSFCGGVDRKMMAATRMIVCICDACVFEACKLFAEPGKLETK